MVSLLHPFPCFAGRPGTCCGYTDPSPCWRTRRPRQHRFQALSGSPDPRKNSRNPFLPPPDYGRPPLDGAEPGVAEEVVGDAPGSNRLVTIGDIGRGRIPDRLDVLDPERVAFVNAHGERRVPAEDALRSILLGGTEAADIVLASRQVEHGLVAEDQTGREKPLRCPAVVVVAVLAGADGAACAVSDSAERRALECDRTREPPLAGGAEGKGRAGDAENLRRDVVVAPVEAPHPAIVVACLVFLSEEEATGHEVFETAPAGDGGEFEVEVVERAII